MEQLVREPLGGGIYVFVTEAHHFTTDTILLADFSKPGSGKLCADLGTGCGTIPLIWLRDNRSVTVDAVEIQPTACALAAESAAYNMLDDKMHVYCADIRDLKGVLPFGSYDLVVSNPPYKPLGTGVRNPNKSKLTSRHENECTLDDICAAAEKLLQFGGRLCICQRPERLPDALEKMRAHGIEPKLLRMVQQRKGKEPKLFLLEGRRGGKKGFMKTLPTLFIEDEQGGFSQEMKTIYGSYKEQVTGE